VGGKNLGMLKKEIPVLGLKQSFADHRKFVLASKTHRAEQICSSICHEYLCWPSVVCLSCSGNRGVVLMVYKS
jgi:hypothetical protein